MRYLWVEDFGEDSEDQEDKQEKWEEYFGIEDNILVYSLEEALNYLDDFENRSNFDAVLLDIRFPVLSDESVISEDDIYERYFSNVITKNMFQKYAGSDVMNDASSGILLFMALVYRYGYNWNNIAFISANIDDEDLSAINTLKELITKVKYGEQLSVREQSLYKTRYRDLFSGNGIVTNKKDVIDESLTIITSENLFCNLARDNYDKEIMKLTTIQERMNEEVPEIKREGLKYCSVRNQFEMIGLKMPPAFEKPTDESLQKCWLFNEWKDTRCDDLSRTKRKIIDMCNLLMSNIQGNVSGFLDMQRKYNDEDSKMTEGSIKRYLKDVVRCASDCPEIRTQENIRVYATNIVEAASSLWESINKPKVYEKNICSYYKYSYYSVMRLTRNWMAHQGINGIDVQFATFIFLISIKGIFDVRNFNVNAQKKYKKLEKDLIDNFGYESVVLRKIDIKEKMTREYDITYKKVNDAIPENYNGQMRLPEKCDPFALISALGHTDSCVRDSVSTVELYRAFWMCIYFGDKYSKTINQEDIHSNSVVEILENVYSYQKP